jgi:hypothetical protein
MARDAPNVDVRRGLATGCSSVDVEICKSGPVQTPTHLPGIGAVGRVNGPISVFLDCCCPEMGPCFWEMGPAA